jgi:hypothetical protein
LLVNDHSETKACRFSVWQFLSSKVIEATTPQIFGYSSRLENAVMKSVVTSFIRDQSGAAELDGMTVFLLAVVFPISMYFMYSTFGGVYLAIFDWFGTAASR